MEKSVIDYVLLCQIFGRYNSSIEIDKGKTTTRQQSIQSNLTEQHQKIIKYLATSVQLYLSWIFKFAE